MNSIPNNHLVAKLVFVGEGNVGKTSLAKRLIYDFYDQGEKLTSGIEISNWQVAINDVFINIKVWDFGGQEIYHSTHQFFITSHALYVFVWNARSEDSLQSFDYWLNVISLLSVDSPILIVLNKADERLKEIDERSLKEKFQNIVGFFKTSVKTGLGISELRNAIISDIKGLISAKYDLPKEWSDIRSDLENSKYNYISFSKFQSICRNHNLKDIDISLVGEYLHDLGTVLFFHDDPILKDILIINPNWVTNAIYKVIDSRLVAVNYGVIGIEEIGHIWKEYENDMHKFLFQLLQKFEIAFNLDKNKIIIPELLSEIKPVIEWNYENNLQFEYQYDFMPFGILPRFIVRVFQLLKPNQFWKHGAVIKSGNTEAYIYSDSFQRRIKISITGEKQLELLAFIRSHFDYINLTFNNLHIDKLIACKCKECKKNINPFYFNLSSAEKNNISELQCGISGLMIPLSEILSLNMTEDIMQTEIAKVEPFIYEWNDTKNLNFEYRFTLPKNDILKYFKNRISSILIKKEVWSEGIILEREQNKALIKNDILNNKITIAIQGIDNLEFLSILRYEFEHVYHEYFNQDYQEYVKCICEECKTSNNPYYYDYSFLRKRKSKNKQDVTCQFSGDDITFIELFGQTTGLDPRDIFNSNTIIEQVLINNSDSVNVGGLTNTENKMKIDKIINKGGQNTFADKIIDSKFEYSSVDQKLIDLITKYTDSDEIKNQLIDELNILKSDSVNERKIQAREKIENFLYTHSLAIGDSVVATALFEIGKYLITSK